MNVQDATGQHASMTADSATIGRVAAVSGAQARVEFVDHATSEAPTVGKFMGVVRDRSLIIGLITRVDEEALATTLRKIATIDLLGEIAPDAQGKTKFQRGITEYPNIDDKALLLTERELGLVYGARDGDHAHIGDLQQNGAIGVHINIDTLVSQHFALLGATGVGKSSGVTILLQEILETRPNLRVFLLDPHNEYGRSFGDKALILNPRNLRLPFWLFNFEEIVDVFFGARPGIEEEVEILGEVIPMAKSAYLQYKAGGERSLSRRRDPRDAGFSADTPVPYRIEDLVALLDERMGKLENRASRVTYHRLISRIQTFRKHPRYAFMFENATIGGDTMAEILKQLFRLPAEGKPMTIMQLAGFPAEVMDSVVSVLSRMAFDFGLWSDGVAPLLFVCEEAHRYAPADKKVGFGPTRRSLSRIAKEGRKYGVFLGLITQRPAEIDATIISQCSTLFVMRLANDRDQGLIRSAVSDAAASLLTFVPSLGTREVFAFGAGVALPTRLRFKELPAQYRPNSEALGNTHSDSTAFSDDMVSAVVERWRSASMSHRGDDMADFGSADAPALQPAALQQTAPQPAAPPPRSDPPRSSLLRKPLESVSAAAPAQPSSFSPRFR